MAAASGSTGCPNVIMIGDCGTGKSTAVEKITGMTGLSSDDMMSHTHTQNRLVSLCGRFNIVDTPGENALEGALEDNIEVMKALNSGPVSLMLFTAKAEKRIEQVVKQVEEYLERFIDFSDLACMIITHMDRTDVKWTRPMICQKLNERFGGDVKVVFSGSDTTSDQICQDIYQRLAEPRSFDIDSSNFLHYFKICRMDMAVLRSIRDKVKVYKKDVVGFQNQLNKWTASDIPDQCFQFNTFMTNRIAELQGELAGEFDWDMTTDKGDMTADQQIGYVAYLSGQLKAELFKIRTLLLQFHSNSEVSNLRKCPHCGIIWGKWEGCDGSTTCGSRPSQAKDWRSGTGQQATFTFYPSSEPYRVERTGVQRATGNGGASGSGAGCGQSITWSTMQPVTSGSGWNLSELNGQAGGMTISCAEVSSTTGAGQVSFDRLFEAARQKAKTCCPKLRRQMMSAGTFGGA